MNGEFERDEHYYDDGKDEEEVILTHAEHKAQGNELYKSKGTFFVLQIVRWPFFGCCMHVGQKREPRAARARPSDYVYDHICQLAK